MYKTERERERERERNVHKVLRLLEGVQIVNIDKGFDSRETSAEAALIAFFSVCSISISPPTDDQRESETLVMKSLLILVFLASLVALKFTNQCTAPMELELGTAYLEDLQHSKPS